MGKYGQAAIKAVNLLHKKELSNPRDAWESAVESLFPQSKYSQAKGCPRSSFLGLCEAGHVKGIPSGDYCKSVLNKEYAIQALNYLLANNRLADNISELWSMVVANKKHNEQMDVVVALWKAGLLEREVHTNE